MSRPTHLDTRTGQRQRYSFETPLEMHAPSPFPDFASQSAIPTTTGTTIQPCPDQQPHEQHQHLQPPSFHYTSQEQPTRGATNEKERHLQREGFIPTYSKYPPLEQHPALHASLADVPQPQIAQLHQAPYHSSPPPGSPGPLPVKTNQEAPIRDDAISIAPDANPLQSPTSPYFQPPTITKSQTPQISDWDPYHQPGQIMHPNQEVKGGTWSYGLCECSNIGTCCLGLLCPCILYGKTQHRLSMKSKKEDPTNMLGYGMCNGSCTAMAVLCGGQWLLATIQHSRTRKAYDIKGDIASDCVRATCCTCCTLIQDEKEIQKREQQRGRAVLERGATLTSPYMSPGLMAYPPPPK